MIPEVAVSVSAERQRMPGMSAKEMNRTFYENKILSGYQPHEVVEWRKNRFEDHLHPLPQGTEVAGVPIHVMYIPARAPCSWLHASQWGLVGGVKCLPCFAQFSDRIACSSQDLLLLVFKTGQELVYD
jgi:hypothetical protein